MLQNGILKLLRSGHQDGTLMAIFFLSLIRVGKILGD
jgi:hypothetical protein